MPGREYRFIVVGLALVLATAGPAMAQSEAPVPPTFEVTALPGSDEIVIVGTAEPGAGVAILDRGETVAVAEANRRGEWAVALGDGLAPGSYSLAVQATSADGRHVLIAAQRIAITVPESDTAPTEIVVVRGDNLWDLAAELYGSGVHFDLLFQANRDEIDKPGAIFPGQVLAVPPLSAADPQN